jgi:hypothetical protein
MDSLTDIGVIPAINFILALFILATALWQTVLIEDIQVQITNNDITYAFNSSRIKNEFDAMQTKLSASSTPSSTI